MYSMTNRAEIYLLCLVVLLLNRATAFKTSVEFDNLKFIIHDLEPIEEKQWYDHDVPDKCYFRSMKHYWGVGEHWGPAKQCWIARCVSPGTVTILSCGKVEPSDDLYTRRYCNNIGMDFSRPFPGCCVRYMCRSFNNSLPYIYNPLVAGGGRESSYYKRWAF